MCRTLTECLTLQNGKSAAQNAHTMSIVRDEWQWKGLYISDWFGT